MGHLDDLCSEYQYSSSDIAARLKANCCKTAENLITSRNGFVKKQKPQIFRRICLTLKICVKGPCKITRTVSHLRKSLKSLVILKTSYWDISLNFFKYLISVPS